MLVQGLAVAVLTIGIGLAVAGYRHHDQIGKPAAAAAGGLITNGLVLLTGIGSTWPGLVLVLVGSVMTLLGMYLFARDSISFLRGHKQ